MNLYVETGGTATKILKDTDPAPSPGWDAATDDLVLWDRHGEIALGHWDKDDKLPGVPWLRDAIGLQAEIGARVNAQTGFDPTSPLTYTQANWDKLTADEKGVAARWRTVPVKAGATDMALEVYTFGELDILWRALNVRGFEGRKLRMSAAATRALVRLTGADFAAMRDHLDEIPTGTTMELDASDKLVNGVNARSLFLGYVQEGVLGTASDPGGQVGIADYLLGRVGTPYASSGLPSQSWTTLDVADTTALGTLMYNVLAFGQY